MPRRLIILERQHHHLRDGRHQRCRRRFRAHMRSDANTLVTRIAFKWVWQACACSEPDGYCEDCGSEHGHTCIVCGWEWCAECWGGEAHAEASDPNERARRLA